MTQRTKRIGESSLVSIDHVDRAVGALIGAGIAATAHGAEGVKAELIGIFERQGDGAWPPLAESTLDAHGADKRIMEDLGQLSSGIRVGPPLFVGGTRIEAEVGWFDEDVHTSHGIISMAALADLHDRGLEELNIPARPWMTLMVQSGGLARVGEEMVETLMVLLPSVAWSAR